MKRPWQEEHAAWMKEHMPQARYVIMIRDRESIVRNWRTTGKWAVAPRPEALANLGAYYDRYRHHADDFLGILGKKQCRIVRFEHLIAAPDAVFGELAEWLDVPMWFDCAPIGAGLHWNRKLAEEFPRGDWLLDDVIPNSRNR